MVLELRQNILVIRTDSQIMGIKNIYERFIWFDSQVRRKKYPNAISLAEQFEISSKTAQRDIDFMRDRLLCPMEYDSSQKGYYYCDDTYSLAMVYLSSEELSALLIAREMLKDISNGCIGEEISSIVNKITNVPSKHMADGNDLDDNFSFQLIEYSPIPENILKIVLDACLKRRRLHFTYASPARGEKSQRTVDPYHLFNYMGTWHLVSYCHIRGMIRDFVLGRMTDLRILDDDFEKPSDFDIKKYFHSSFGIYKGHSKTEVTLRFSPEKAKWIKDQVWHRNQKSRSLKDGSLELSFPVAEFSEIKMEILKHGDKVEVVKPKALRDLIKTEAFNISKIY
jgi:predicted DNA-binding transcriptional regulator YafY